MTKKAKKSEVHKREKLTKVHSKSYPKINSHSSDVCVKGQQYVDGVGCKNCSPFTFGTDDRQSCNACPPDTFSGYGFSKCFGKFSLKVKSKLIQKILKIAIICFIVLVQSNVPNDKRYLIKKGLIEVI